MNPGDMAQAAQSNDVLGALQKLLVSRIPTPEQEANQRANRGRTMQEYQQELMTPSLPSHAPASMMLADMAASFRPGVHPMYAASKGAKSGMDLQLKMDAADQAGRIAAAKVGFDEAKDIDKLGVLELTALRGALGSGGKGLSPIVKMDKDGNMVVYDPVTQKSTVVHASQRGEYQRIFSTAYKEAVDNGMKEPESYAHGVAQRVLMASPGYNPQDPSRIPTSPGAPAAERPNPTASENSTVPVEPITAVVPDGLDDRVYIIMQEWVRNQEALRLASGNPSGQEYQTAQRNLGLIRKELKEQYGFDPVKDKVLETPPPAAPKGTPMSSQDNRSMTYRDPRMTESDKGYGGEEGKDLAKERTSMSQLSSKNMTLMTNLNLLEGIYAKNPDIPEGELGPYVQMFRSGAKSLGIPVSASTTQADFARAVAEKFALEQRTAGEANLLPGAISNYENQLLARMAPTLSMTNKGRLDLLAMMREMARTNMRLASEATEWAKENNNRLTPEWYARKDRIIREETARLRVFSDELIKKHGVQ